MKQKIYWLAAVALAVTLTLLLLGSSRPGVTLASSPSDRHYDPTETPEGLSSAEWAKITSQIQQGYYQPHPITGRYQARYPLTIGSIVQQAYLKASNTGEFDSFGYSVALSGDTLAVGAPREASKATGVNGDQSDNSAADAGAVYIFTRTGSSWSQQAYLKASNAEKFDWFGWSVALSGDTLVVRANGEDSNATGINEDQTNNLADGAGAAYGFTGLEPASPEIAILGHGQVIEAGNTSPSPTDHTDFSSIPVSGGQITRTFTISNRGTANLNLTGPLAVSITGPAADDFSLVADPATPVAPNDTTSFQVRFDPSAAGPRLATVTIANNDSDESLYDFAIQGVGTETPVQPSYLPLIFKNFIPHLPE